MFERQYETPNLSGRSKQFQHMVEATTDFDTRFIKHLDITDKQPDDLSSKFQTEKVYVGGQQTPNSKAKKKSKTLNSDGEFYRARLLGNIVDKIKEAKDVTNLTKYSEHDVLLDRFDKLQNVIQEAVYQSSMGRSLSAKKNSSQGDAAVKQIMEELSSIKKEDAGLFSQNNNELSQSMPIHQQKKNYFQHQPFLENMDHNQREYPRQITQNAFHLRRTSIERPKSYSKITFTYTSPTPNNYKLHSPNKVITQSIRKIPRPTRPEKLKQQDNKQKVGSCRKCGRNCPCQAKTKACMKCGRKCNHSRSRKDR